MAIACGMCIDEFPISLHCDGAVSCVRQTDHNGPHLSQNSNDSWYLWQSQVCDRCDCGEDDDFCVTFAEIPPDVAVEYLGDRELVGEGWDT